MLEPIVNVLAYALYELLTVQGLLLLTTTIGVVILLLIDRSVPEWYITVWSSIIGYYLRGVTTVQPLKRGKLIEEIKIQ